MHFHSRNICSIDDMIPKFMFPPNNNTVPIVRRSEIVRKRRKKLNKVICSIVEDIRWCRTPCSPFKWKYSIGKALMARRKNTLVPDYSMRFIIKRLVIVDVCLTISFSIGTDENWAYQMHQLCTLWIREIILPQAQCSFTIGEWHTKNKIKKNFWNEILIIYTSERLCVGIVLINWICHTRIWCSSIVNDFFFHSTQKRNSNWMGLFDSVVSDSQESVKIGLNWMLYGESCARFNIPYAPGVKAVNSSTTENTLNK